MVGAADERLFFVDVDDDVAMATARPRSSSWASGTSSCSCSIACSSEHHLRPTGRLSTAPTVSLLLVKDGQAELARVADSVSLLLLLLLFARWQLQRRLMEILRRFCTHNTIQYTPKFIGLPIFKYSL